jgi:RNA polymerase sigma-70 factor (ECF subfamily)
MTATGQSPSGAQGIFPPHPWDGGSGQRSDQRQRGEVKHAEFDAIYTVYSKQLYTFVLWMTRNRATADDILQTVFVKVWDQGGGPANEDERRRWLFTVTRNACMDSFRSASRFSNFRSRYCAEFEEDESATSDAAESGEVWGLLAELPEIDRSILYLHIKVGYSYAEIGEVLALTENNVRVKAFRALKRLREIMVKREQA